MADSKSSLTQIAQSVLDESNQSIKVSVVSGGGGGGGGGSVSVTNFPATQAVSGPLTNTELRASAVPVSGSVNVSNFPASQTVTGPLTDTQLRASAVPVSVSGVATASNQTSQTTELQAIKVNTARLDYVGRVRLVYSSTNVTTGTWVELLASVGATAVKEIEIFDSSGETLELGVGAAASEVSKSYVFPGGNGKIPLQIAASARLAIKAVSATANSGEILINLYG
jgi:hypothetical protein